MDGRRRTTRMDVALRDRRRPAHDRNGPAVLHGRRQHMPRLHLPSLYFPSVGSAQP